MNRRERWHAVLDAEIKRWSEKSYEELRSTLSELLVYEVEFDSKQHQVEVEFLEAHRTICTFRFPWTMAHWHLCGH